MMNDATAPRDIKLAGQEVELLCIAKRTNHALSTAGLLCAGSGRLQMLRVRVEGDQDAVSQRFAYQDGHSTSATTNIQHFCICLRVHYFDDYPSMSGFIKRIERPQAFDGGTIAHIARYCARKRNEEKQLSGPVDGTLIQGPLFVKLRATEIRKPVAPLLHTRLRIAPK